MLIPPAHQPQMVEVPHRPRHLPAQHAGAATIIDNRTRPLTTRHWIAMASPT